MNSFVNGVYSKRKEFLPYLGFICYKRKEFTPKGADSLLFNVDLFKRACMKINRKSQLFLLYEMAENTYGVSIHKSQVFLATSTCMSNG